jgi:hypothetical protein
VTPAARLDVFYGFTALHNPFFVGVRNAFNKKTAFWRNTHKNSLSPTLIMPKDYNYTAGPGHLLK